MENENKNTCLENEKIKKLHTTNVKINLEMIKEARKGKSKNILIADRLFTKKNLL